MNVMAQAQLAALVKDIHDIAEQAVVNRIQEWVLWAQAQGKSHHDLAVEHRDNEAMLTEHNALSTAYFSVAREMHRTTLLELQEQQAAAGIRKA